MLVIVITGIVAVELLILVIGISIPESRLQARQTLKFEDLRHNVCQLRQVI
jgi:uncharacterized membrane protein